VTRTRALVASIGLVAVVLTGTATGAQPAPGVSRSDRLVAGAARVDLDVPAGAPLAGYGALSRRLVVPDLLARHAHAFWFRPSVGHRDPLAARALVLEGGGRRVVWIAVDLVAVDRAFTAALVRRLDAADPDRVAVIVSASHTHSGPGAFIPSAVMGFVAVDRYDDDVRERLLSSVVDAVRRADRARVPARIGTLAVPGPLVTSPRIAEPIDREVTVMKIARDDGRAIAAVWNFSVHGTMLGPRNLLLSADVMGAATRRLEDVLGVPVLFVNGAVGDVSPRSHGSSMIPAVAEPLVAAVESAWRRIRARDATAPRLAREVVDLGPPALSVRHCVGRWVPRALRLPLGQVLPADARLVAVAAGDAAWVTVPGELASLLGARIKRAARTPARTPFVAGLSNDYLGYFVAPEQAEHIGYVTCASVHGAEAGACLAERSIALLARVGSPSAPVPRDATGCRQAGAPR
jgi:hypothetical protein